VFLLVLVTRFSFVNVFLFYVVFEIRLVPILVIIVFHGRQPERLRAGLYFIVYTRVFSFPYLLIILMSILGSVSFVQEVKFVISWLFNFFIVIPFLVKMPVMGLHY